MQLTVRFEADTARALRDLADRDGLSLNQAAVRLVRDAIGLGAGGSRRVVGDSLDDFFGTWTAEEADDFNAATSLFERVDPELWG